MLKYDKETNTIIETDKRIKHTEEGIEFLKKLFIANGLLNGDK